MKQILKYGLLLISLLIAGIWVHTSPQEALFIHKHIPTEHSAENTSECSFNAPQFLSLGSQSELNHVNYTPSQSVNRVTNTLSYEMRITHSVLLNRLLYAQRQVCYLFKSSVKQLDGYYLYYLCKMLN